AAAKAGSLLSSRSYSRSLCNLAQGDNLLDAYAYNRNRRLLDDTHTSQGQIARAGLFACNRSHNRSHNELRYLSATGAGYTDRCISPPQPVPQPSSTSSYSAAIVGNHSISLFHQAAAAGSPPSIAADASAIAGL